MNNILKIKIVKIIILLCSILGIIAFILVLTNYNENYTNTDCCKDGKLSRDQSWCCMGECSQCGGSGCGHAGPTPEDCCTSGFTKKCALSSDVDCIIDGQCKDGGGGEGTLFIFVEAKGFNTSDFESLPNSEFVNKTFQKVVIIFPVLISWGKYPDKTTKIQEELIEYLNDNLKGYDNIEYALNIYWQSDGFMCGCLDQTEVGEKYACEYDGCGAPVSSKSATTNCPDSIKNCVTDQIEIMNKQTKDGKSISYLFSDLEGIKNDTKSHQNVIDQMEKLAKEGYKLGWTEGRQSARLEAPKGSENPDLWNFDLIQMYTDNTEEIYKNCKVSSEILSLLSNSRPSEKAVPMICGSGDCIEGSDDRLNSQEIKNLIESRPTDYFTKNFGIWYGAFPPPNCDDEGKNCTYNAQGWSTEDENCSKGCCNSWHQ